MPLSSHGAPLRFLTLAVALGLASLVRAEAPADAGMAAAAPPVAVVPPPAAQADAGVAAPPAKPEPPPPGSMNECPWGISKEMTERLGSIAEKDFPANSKCHYTGMLTRKTVLDVNWTLDGKTEPPLRVSTRRCMVSPPAGNEEFVVEVPSDLTAQCPETAAFLTKFRGALGKEEALDGNQGNPQKRKRPYALLGLVVAVAVGLILWRRSKEKSGPAGS